MSTSPAVSVGVPGGAGCVGLISSGTSGEESAFLDASESGNDVFFLTASRLVPQDLDSALDVYDAHVCSASSPCLARRRRPAAGAVCERRMRAGGAGAAQPGVFGAPSSTTCVRCGEPRAAASGRPVVKRKRVSRGAEARGRVAEVQEEAQAQARVCVKRRRGGCIGWVSGRRGPCGRATRKGNR